MLFCIFSLLAVYSAYLLYIGELDIDYVVQRQNKADQAVLYVSGVHSGYFKYKQSLYTQASPEIVAIGSSRAMPVRGEFFLKSFVNWGGSVSSVSAFEKVVESILVKPNVPKLALVFMDVWWFNDQNPDATTEYDIPGYPTFPTPATIYSASDAIYQNRQRAETLLKNPKDRLGLLGIISNEGFDRFGSYRYVSTVTGERVSNDIEFSDTKSRITQNKAGFEYGEKADEKLLEKFLNSIKSLQNKGIHVIAIFPPFAPPVYDRMKATGKYNYIQDLKIKMDTLRLSFHDFSDVSSIYGGLDPKCEFIDGYHGGGVTYARIMANIAKSDDQLKAVLDIVYIDQVIQTRVGHAEDSDRYLRGKPEVDFLKLDCPK